MKRNKTNLSLFPFSYFKVSMAYFIFLKRNEKKEIVGGVHCVVMGSRTWHSTSRGFIVWAPGCLSPNNRTKTKLHLCYHAQQQKCLSPNLCLFSLHFFFFFLFFPLLSDFWCYTNNSLENLRHLCTKNVWDFSFSFNHIKLFQNCQNFLVIGCPWCNFFTF